MSVKGFNFDGTVQKYDYDHLDNKIEKTTLAPEFIPAKAYLAGDMVFYEGKLYSRKTDGTDSSWTAGNWTETDIEERLTAVEGDVSDLKGDFNVYGEYINVKIAEWENGKAYSTPASVTTITPSDTTVAPVYSCTAIAATPGDVFVITGTGGSGAKLWVWTKSDGTIINRADSNVTLDNEIITAPNESAWLLSNVVTNNPHKLIKGKTVNEKINLIKSDIDNNITKFTVVNPADYENKLAKITEPCCFAIGGGSAWEDLPTGFVAGVFAQIRYASSNMLQKIWGFSSLITYERVVNTQTGTIVYDWRTTVDSTLTKSGFSADAKVVGDRLSTLRNDIDNNITKFTVVNPADYDNKLSKITIPCSFNFSPDSGWIDLPENNIYGAFIQFRISANHMVQKIIVYSSLKSYYRVLSPATDKITYDWRIGNYNQTVWYAIGDSITAGSYSEDGHGYVANNAEWSYPNQIKRMTGCTVTNLAVPGAKITEFQTQANRVGSMATLVTIMGGVNDYGSDTASIGTISDATDSGTIMGALKGVIETIANNAPNARIVLIAPIPQKVGSIDTKWSINRKRYNFTFEELFTALKTIAEYYNIELVDAMHNGPVNMLNITTVLSDATHPTKAFENTLSEWMLNHLF